MLSDDQKKKSRCVVCKLYDPQKSNENRTVCSPPGASLEFMKSGNPFDCKNFIEEHLRQGEAMSDDVEIAKKRDNRASKDKLVLVEIASLVMQTKIPKSYSEMGVLLWQAFHLGKKYRDEGGKE